MAAQSGTAAKALDARIASVLRRGLHRDDRDRSAADGSVWTHGRALHLSEVADGVEYRPLPQPNVLFKTMGIPSHVLTEQYEPLAYENENSELIMKISFPPHATDDDQPVQDG